MMFARLPPAACAWPAAGRRPGAAALCSCTHAAAPRCGAPERAHQRHARRAHARARGPQVRREEEARQRALTAHNEQLARDARGGRPSRAAGSVLSDLMRGWAQLLEEAIEAEHEQVRPRPRGAGSWKERAQL